MPSALTTSGLNIKRLADVISSLQSQAQITFGDLVPTGDKLDLSEGSTLGRMIGLVSPSQTDLWEALLEVYSAFDPNAAEGIALDNLAILTGLVRKNATATISKINCFGDYNTVIPQGSVVSSSYTNKTFTTNVAVTLDANLTSGVSIGVQTVANSTAYTATATDGTNTFTFTYTSSSSATASEILSGLESIIASNFSSSVNAAVSGTEIAIDNNNKLGQISWALTSNLYFTKSKKVVDIVCTETGPNTQVQGTIDTIATPVLGWTSIDQFLDATVGANTETDSELRTRMFASKYIGGSNISSSLSTELSNLDGVTQNYIYENDTNSTDSNSVPAKSFMALVVGGLDSEIAQVVWNNKPTGIQTYGNTTVNITDIQGLTKSVNFERPTYIDVYVSVAVTVVGTFPAGGADLIKTAIFNYINGRPDRLGSNLIYSRLYTPVNSVGGHEITSLYLGTSSSPTSTSNVTIAFNQIAKVELSNITVTVS